MNWPWSRQERRLTVVDGIDDDLWELLDNDEQGLVYIIERRQLGRATLEQTEQQLLDWRRSIAYREDIRRRSTVAARSEEQTA